MLLLALAVAPGIAIMWYIYLKDKYDREPLHYLAVSFFLGMLSTLPAIAIQMASAYVFGDVFAGDSIGMYAFYAFFVVALSEEFSKYLMLRYFAYRKKEFNEPFDGIVLWRYDRHGFRNTGKYFVCATTWTLVRPS